MGLARHFAAYQLCEARLEQEKQERARDQAAHEARVAELLKDIEFERARTAEAEGRLEDAHREYRHVTGRMLHVPYSPAEHAMLRNQAPPDPSARAPSGGIRTIQQASSAYTAESIRQKALREEQLRTEAEAIRNRNGGGIPTN
jgi:hypothetical protein